MGEGGIEPPSAVANGCLWSAEAYRMLYSPEYQAGTRPRRATMTAFHSSVSTELFAT